MVIRDICVNLPGNKKEFMEVKIINKSHHPLPGYATPLSRNGYPCKSDGTGSFEPP